eukprot:COSAG01_NODE_787_length_13598_cov_17.218535_6_plen_28_part_01
MIIETPAAGSKTTSDWVAVVAADRRMPA